MPQASGPHLPVLLKEVLDALGPCAGLLVVDGTFGAGGYSRALLEAGAEVIAIDRDPDVASLAADVLAEFPGKFRLVHGKFGELDALARSVTDRPVDAVVLDVGVSSMQLDEAGRGFSFMREGPLDMRMGREGVSAADLVNALSEADLANLIFAYGEERRSRRIAKAIVIARADAPLATTTALARVIEGAVGRGRPGDIHPATRAFQALRIAVNDELGQLVAALFAAERLLGEGGRLVVVSFHSLEDRIVKRFLSPEKAGPARSRHLPQAGAEAPRWTDVAKPRRAGEAEVRGNPRARSAVLRSARRTGATARAEDRKGLGVPGVSLGGVAG